MMDLVEQVHSTHHPVDFEGWYKDQKPEAVRFAKLFCSTRLPKFLNVCISLSPFIPLFLSPLSSFPFPSSPLVLSPLLHINSSVLVLREGDYQIRLAVPRRRHPHLCGHLTLLCHARYSRREEKESGGKGKRGAGEGRERNEEKKKKEEY